MSNFTFLPQTFKDLAEAARKAEEQIMGDPRAVRFNALFAALQHRNSRREQLICC